VVARVLIVIEQIFNSFLAIHVSLMRIQESGVSIQKSVVIVVSPLASKSTRF